MIDLSLSLKGRVPSFRALCSNYSEWLLSVKEADATCMAYETNSQAA